jgi:hypothetical protein
MFLIEAICSEKKIVSVYTYNVVLRSVCVTIAAMEKQQCVVFITVEVQNA